MKILSLLLLSLTLISIQTLGQKSLDFDGSNDVVTTSSPGVIGSGNRTIELWVKTSQIQSTQQVLVDMGNMNTGGRFTFNIRSNGNLRIELGGNGFTGTKNMADGKWHHVAVTYDHNANPKARIYVDGIQDVSGNFTVTTNTQSTPILLGRRNDNINYYRGQMDEVRIWSRALSQNTLRNWMCQEVNSSHPDYSSLHAYYKLDTLTGNAVRDFSGNNRNGVRNGATWVNNGGPVGHASKAVYTSGTKNLFLTHPDGDSMRVTGGSSSANAMHIYYRNGIPNRTGIPASINSFDTSRHWGVHFVGGNNPTHNMNYYYTANTHFQAYAGCNNELLTRANNAATSWTVTSSTNSNGAFSLSGQTAREYMIGYTASGKPVIISPSQKDTSDVCAGDTITLQNSTQGFSYQWLRNGQILIGDTFNTLDVSSAGSYSMILSNGSSCNDTSNILEVIYHQIPSVSWPSLPSYCEDTFSVALTGGMPAGGTYQNPYMSGNLFLVNNAGSGQHKVIYEYADQYGCGDTVSQTIQINSLPVVGVSFLSNTCIDTGSIALSGGTPTGGSYYVNGSSTINFDPATLGVGTHQVKYTYTDGNGCSNFDTTDVVVNGLPTLQLVLSKDKFCEYDGAYTPNGQSPKGGFFSGPGMNSTTKQFEPKVAGVGKHQLTYDYTESTTGCSNSISDTVEVFPKPAAPTITVNGLTLTASGNGTFQWFDANSEIRNETSSTYTTQVNGTFKVRVTENGCRSDFSSETNIDFVGISELDQRQIRIYPNPVQDHLTIEIGSEKSFNVRVTDLSGKLLIEDKLEGGQIQMNTSLLTSGMYLLELDIDGGVEKVKILKQ